MDSRKATQKDINAAHKRYGKSIYWYIQTITDDEDRAGKIFQIVLWEIPTIESGPEPKMGYFGEIKAFARALALAFIKHDPSFDIWGEWKKEPDFYPLTDPALTPLHKKLFCYLFYRDADFKDLAAHFRITLEEVRQKTSEAANIIIATMEAQAHEIRGKLRNTPPSTKTRKQRANTKAAIKAANTLKKNIPKHTL